MQDNLVFLKPLIEYWQVAHAEWLRFGGDIHTNPLALSPDHPPKEFEEVVLEFLDDYFRRSPAPEPDPIPGITWPKGPVWAFPPEEIHVPVTVRAQSRPDGKSVKLTVDIGKEAYEEFGKLAYERWKTETRDTR
jgi:hypothetical protein